MRRFGVVLLAGIAATVLVLAAGAAPAVPKGTIVLHGSSGPSHPKLNVVGSSLVLFKTQGMRADSGTNCKLVNHGLECPLANIGAIELVMGPSEDKVEVVDPLPVPLVVHLGAGSDQLLGNDESDTCYSEGAKRNRCWGFGGDDVCITGDQNSDCVGGEGDDLCVHGAGSDGCFGGPGDDICEMGPGQDGCHGGPGDDKLYGGPAPDQLYGGPGRDFCDGGPGVGRSHECESGPGD